MRPRALSSVAHVIGGRSTGEGTVSGAAVYHREVRPGDLFVAFPGERFDGHSFVDRAFAAGASGGLVSSERRYAGPVVVVEDTAASLLRLAEEERRSLSADVIGVTGSSGKTSVKDLTAAVLGTGRRVASSPKSFNTAVGVPLTLLNAPPDVEAVVCEMGSRGRGHIRLLCDSAQPTVGIVTNVGTAHMEMFGSREAVADAKAELVEALPEGGTAILNADDPVVRGFAARTAARPLLYGTTEDAEVRAEGLRLDALGRPSFTLSTPSGVAQVDLPLIGEHMASNALAAAACGIALGLSPAECAAGLADARVSPWRMETFETESGIRVLNDAYNANPASMAAALKAARWMAGDGRAIAVLGEMAELGAIADEEHEHVGELVARLGIERLVVVGPRAARIAAGAIREGVEPDRVVTVDTVEDALEEVRSAARPGDVVLLKASRVVELERVADWLRAEAATHEAHAGGTP